MSTVIIQKEKIKGLIASTESEFKYKTVAMLNNAAFGGEKLFVSSFDEIKKLIERDPLFCNLVIDGNCEVGQAVLKDIAQLQSYIISHENLFTIIYVPSGSPLLDAAVAKKFPRTLISAPPIARDHFTKFLHDRKGRSSQGQNTASPSAAPTANAAKDSESGSNPAKKAMSETQRMSFEASSHVRVTIEDINTLTKDRSKFDVLAHIGQRFNGLFGTFALFKGHSGFTEVTALSSIIDDICRTYEVKSDTRPAAITEAHTNLLLAAAKCSFQVLMCMRDSKPIDDKLLAEFSRITAEHAADQLILKRSSQEQVDIDALIDSEMKSA